MGWFSHWDPHSWGVTLPFVGRITYDVIPVVGTVIRAGETAVRTVVTGAELIGAAGAEITGHHGTGARIMQDVRTNARDLGASAIDLGVDAAADLIGVATAGAGNLASRSLGVAANALPSTMQLVRAGVRIAEEGLPKVLRPGVKMTQETTSRGAVRAGYTTVSTGARAGAESASVAARAAAAAAKARNVAAKVAAGADRVAQSKAARGVVSTVNRVSDVTGVTTYSRFLTRAAGGRTHFFKGKAGGYAALKADYERSAAAYVPFENPEFDAKMAQYTEPHAEYHIADNLPQHSGHVDELTSLFPSGYRDARLTRPNTAGFPDHITAVDQDALLIQRQIDHLIEENPAAYQELKVEFDARAEQRMAARATADAEQPTLQQSRISRWEPSADPMLPRRGGTRAHNAGRNWSREEALQRVRQAGYKNLRVYRDAVDHGASDWLGVGSLVTARGHVQSRANASRNLTPAPVDPQDPTNPIDPPNPATGTNPSLPLRDPGPGDVDEDGGGQPSGYDHRRHPDHTDDVDDSGDDKTKTGGRKKRYQIPKEILDSPNYNSGRHVHTDPHVAYDFGYLENWSNNRDSVMIYLNVFSRGRGLPREWFNQDESWLINQEEVDSIYASTLARRSNGYSTFNHVLDRGLQAGLPAAQPRPYIKQDSDLGRKALATYDALADSYLTANANQLGIGTAGLYTYEDLQILAAYAQYEAVRNATPEELREGLLNRQMGQRYTLTRTDLIPLINLMHRNPLIITNITVSNKPAVLPHVYSPNLPLAEQNRNEHVSSEVICDVLSWLDVEDKRRRARQSQ